MSGTTDAKSSRLLTIYVRLMSGQTLKKSALAEEFNVTHRSIQRDMEDLRCFLADTITDEVDVTGNMQYLPLEEVAWVEALSLHGQLSNRIHQSLDAKEAMLAKGYDNAHLGAKLKQYYETLAKEEE